MKTLLSHTHLQSVTLAIEIFCYRAAKAVGGLAVALGGCDQLVFTGGIGEHAAAVRGRIARQLEFLGVRLDEDANRVNAAVVSRPESVVAIHVIRVDEGRQIAQQTAKLASGHGQVA